jgi:hypothetical protein
MRENSYENNWDNISIRHLIKTLDSELAASQITLRDKFAMAALSMYSHDSAYELGRISKNAYMMADALMEARKNDHRRRG